MVCRTARQVNDDEQSKLQPDIVTKDNQTFDFSVSKNPLAMYKTKIEKYSKIFDNKNVIPIIITPWLQMDPRSIIEMSRYCKPDKQFKSLSFWTIYMESQKLEKYSSYSKENNLNHFDTEVQRTAQAAQSSAKKAQTNNDEIVIEIELEDTLNRISQNETVPGTSQSKGLVTF
ncbi:Hypothetical_protein [Hexamita inflata]|uniref:Hypothetical_protein n=1 Tax=Hexamita inflata TaxID=28002 RepID=A0AA86NWA3_9EUKA|nr:Hypothetical protein HINF_LOCUS14803 [Hexamita inflata]